MSGSPQIRVLLVDDHPLVREWLSNLLHQHADLRVCGEAENQGDALRLIEDTAPQIAVVDISLGQGSGLDFIKVIKSRFPSLIVLVLSMHDEAIYAERVIRAGARGYVMKKESTKKIVEAIRHVASGKLYLSKDVMAFLAEKIVSGTASTGAFSINQLSDREFEVFRLIGQGYDTREVAKSLDVNIKTVQTYCSRIKEKLGVRTGAELLREAIQWRDGTSAR